MAEDPSGKFSRILGPKFKNFGDAKDTDTLPKDLVCLMFGTTCIRNLVIDNIETKKDPQ